METMYTIPLSIEAKSRKDLPKQMLLNNIKHSSFFRYFDIGKDGTKWVAWYFFKLTTSEMIDEATK